MADAECFIYRRSSETVRSDVDKNIERAIHLIESNTTTNIRSALLPLSRVGKLHFLLFRGSWSQSIKIHQLHTVFPSGAILVELKEKA